MIKLQSLVISFSALAKFLSYIIVHWQSYFPFCIGKVCSLLHCTLSLHFLHWYSSCLISWYIMVVTPIGNFLFHFSKVPFLHPCTLAKLLLFVISLSALVTFLTSLYIGEVTSIGYLPFMIGKASYFSVH